MAELAGIAGLAVLVFALAALAQAVSGFGSALVAVPLLAFFVGPVDAVVAATGVSLLLSGVAWRRERAHVDASLARRLTIAGAVGMPVGLVVLSKFDEHALSVLIACGLLVLVGLLWRDVKLPSGKAALVASGVTSGMLLTSTGMNGPPLVLSLHGAGLSARGFRATLQAVFAGQDLVAVVAFAATGQFDGDTLAVVVGGVLGLPFGWALGNRIFHGLSPERFRSVVLVGLVVTALVALAKVATG